MKFWKIASVASALVVSSAANAASVLLDEFTITKNGSVLFQDTFSNGLLPPDNGGNTQQYKVLGGPIISESNGKLSLNAMTGEDVIRPDVGEMRRQGLRVKTSMNSALPNKGLRTDDTFSVTGLFDLTDLFSVRERYGVRLTDAGSTMANDVVGLSVMRTSDSQMSVVFHSTDTTDATDISFVDFGAYNLESGHEQISLTLARIDPLNNQISASFAYVDDGVMGSITSFSASEAIFNGEDFTRAQAMYLAPVPVPAAVWLFTSGLVSLAGVARRKKY